MARALNAHPSIACASDPMAPLFNSFRHDIASDTYRDSHGRFEPLGDYFEQNSDLLDSIWESDFSRTVTGDSAELIETVRSRAMPYSGNWARSLPEQVVDSTYEEWIERFIDLIWESCGKDQKAGVVSFKEVWTNEFAPAFLRSFRNSKVLFVIRDPRAVAASKNVTSEKYSLLFLARQWRKLAWLAHRCSGEFPGRTMVLRYEDLVLSQEDSFRKICTFTGIPYLADLLDESKYLDGEGKPWSQNSSYRPRSSGINSETIQRWKTVLSLDERKLIELVCRDGMNGFGYESEFAPLEILEVSPSEHPRVSEDEMANWLTPFALDLDPQKFLQALEVEIHRFRSLYDQSDGTEKAEPVAQAFC